MLTYRVVMVDDGRQMAVGMGVVAHLVVAGRVVDHGRDGATFRIQIYEIKSRSDVLYRFYR